MDTSAPHNIRDACQNPSYAEALSQLVENASRADVIEDLTAGGLSRDEAATVVKQAARLLEEAGRSVGSIEIVMGIVFIAGGLGVTLLTYLMVADTGGFYFIWYGAVVYGVASIVRGFSLRKRGNRGRLRDQIYAARQAALSPSRVETETGRVADGPKQKRRFDY